MRFFIPEWDDRVDPGYDFLTDTHSASHQANPLKNDYYMWDIFGIDKVPFDGVLVSIATIQQNSKKYHAILDAGIHQFLRLPQNFEIIADCGAFSYIKEKVPPYKTKEVLQLYADLGFNYGVTVDHLVVPMFKEQNQERIRITYKNGVEAFEEWKLHYKENFQLIVAVQGAEISDYMTMFNDYYRLGVRHFAFGSLVRAPTFFITNLLNNLIADIKSTRKSPESIHLFGIARCALFPKFKELEELDVRVSFDSASYLRKAWLTSANTQFNYIDPLWEGYTALRIPQTISSTEAKYISQSEYQSLAQDCLDTLRKYDNNNSTLDDTMEKLKEFNIINTGDEKLLGYYRRTLKSKVWKKCPCPICKEIGIDVAIFRGNNRNRRRGFHNLFTFYNLLKDETTWEWWKTKEITKKMKNRERTSLEFLRDKKKVLILTSCTKNKLGYDDTHTSQAQDMYQGTLFKKVKMYADIMHFDYRIISAEYGLLLPTDHINGYNKRLKTAKDVKEIQGGVEEKLLDQIAPYETIVVIAGEKYRDVLLNLFSDERFVFLKARGIGEMIKIVSDAIPKNRKLLDF
jgi:hypothetical protein